MVQVCEVSIGANAWGGPSIGSVEYETGEYRGEEGKEEGVEEEWNPSLRREEEYCEVESRALELGIGMGKPEGTVVGPGRSTEGSSSSLAGLFFGSESDFFSEDFFG